MGHSYGRVNFYNTAGSDVVATISADRGGAKDAGAITFDYAACQRRQHRENADYL